MPPFVAGEAVLQRVVDDLLYARVRCRVDLDSSLQEIFHAEVDVANGELLEHMLHDGRRLQRCGHVAAHDVERARDGARRCLR
jgi:hypothetical protein